MENLLPFADVILRLLARLSGRARRPVRTIDLSARTGAALRTLRWYLARLEAAGLVTRRSPKSGWLPA